MKLFKNKVGRPSKKLIKERIIFTLVAIFLFISLMSGITMIISNKIIKIRGNVKETEGHINLWCDKYTYNVNENIKCYTNKTGVKLSATTNNLIGYSSSYVTKSNDMTKSLKYSKPGKIKIIASKKGYKNTEKTINIVDEEYDLVLFWGQSNMVGTAGRYSYENKNNSVNGKYIDSDITSKYYSYANISVPSKVAYEYRLYNDNGVPNERLVSIKDGSKLGENLAYDKNKLLYEYYDGTYRCTENKDIYSSGCPSYNYSLQQSKGTNMIPQFAKTYYEMTGRKIIVVFTAFDGTAISEFLDYNMRKSDKTVAGENYTYEAMKLKYEKAVAYLNNHGYKIGRRFYVAMQGEQNASNTTKLDPSLLSQNYYEAFMKVHNNLKSNFQMEFGIINYTTRKISQKSNNSIKSYNEAIHNSQKLLVKNNEDIYLGSTLAWDAYYYGYKNYFCPNLNGNDNSIHLTSASLSQIGKESAKAATKGIKNILTDQSPHILFNGGNYVKYNVNDGGLVKNFRIKIKDTNDWIINNTYNVKSFTEKLNSKLYPTNKNVNLVYAKDNIGNDILKMVTISKSGSNYKVDNSPNLSYIYNNGNSIYFFIEDGEKVKNAYFNNTSVNKVHYNYEKLNIYKKSSKVYFSVNINDFTLSNSIYYGYIKTCDINNNCTTEKIAIKK